VTALGLATQHRFGGCFNRSRSDSIKLRDRAQNYAAMPQQNAEVLEILLCQIADDREVNGVVDEYSLRPIDASHSAMPFMALPVDGM